MASAAGSLVVGDDEAAAAIPRRCPTPVLRPALDRCLPTGVSLDGARVVVGLDEGGVGAALVGRLEAQGATVHAVAAGTPTEQVADEAAAFAADGVTGVYWLPALDVEVDLSATDLEGWRESLRRRVTCLYALMRGSRRRRGWRGDVPRLGHPSRWSPWL